MAPAESKYTKDHEWVRLEGDTATFGISDYAQGELGDVVFVELPAVGATVKQGDTFGVVESVKAASDLYAPISGEVVAVNDTLQQSPEQVNKEPYGGGWMLRVRPSNLGELDSLMDAAAYEDYLKGLH